jgi:hypothetical protein
VGSEAYQIAKEDYFYAGKLTGSLMKLLWRGSEAYHSMRELIFKPVILTGC